MQFTVVRGTRDDLLESQSSNFLGTVDKAVEYILAQPDGTLSTVETLLSLEAS